MNNEQQPQTSLQTSNQLLQSNAPKKNMPKKVALFLTGILLVGGIGYGSYLYGSSNTKRNISSQPTSSLGAQKVSNNPKQQVDTNEKSFHTVSFGKLDRDPKVLIKIALPENYQAIARDNGADTFRSLFGDNQGSFIYHGGSWEIGNPEDGDGSSWGKVGVMAIASDWYDRNGFASYGGFKDDYASDSNNTTINGYDFSTAKRKKDSLNKLISDTSTCVKDFAKGFVMSGGFNVCYKPVLLKQSYAAYDPIVELSGYASINNVPYVLFGYVNVAGGLDNYSIEDVDKAGNDFKAGKIPGPTLKNINDLVDALKNSSVTSR